MINVLKEMGIQQWKRRSFTEGNQPSREVDSENKLEHGIDQPPIVTQENEQHPFSQNTDEINDTIQMPSFEQVSGSDAFESYQAEAMLQDSSLEKSKQDKPEQIERPELTRDNSQQSHDVDQVSQTDRRDASFVKPVKIESANNQEVKPNNENITSQEFNTKTKKPLLLKGLIDDNEIESSAYIPEFEQQQSVIGDQNELATSDTKGISWPNLEARLQTNEHCPSCGWGNAFLGSGNQQADWLFVTDAPNKIETKEKVLFTGRAGNLFEAMLLALGLERSQVYMTSVFKCAPKDDFSITPQCNEILQQQISLIVPKVIVSFGEFAAQALIKSNHSLSELRKQNHVFFDKSLANIPVIPTFTPAQMLDDNSLKAEVWKDLKKSLQLMGNHSF